LRRCPRWTFDTSQGEDIKNYAEALPKLVGVGMRIPTAWAQGKLKIPLPEDEKEEILTVASPPAVLNPELRPEPGKETPPQKESKAALKAAPGAQPDALTAAVDRLTRESAPIMAGWLRQIEAMLESSESLEEFQARLKAAYPALDTSVLADRLATAMTTMHLTRRSDVTDEE
jgi:phage gp29-like protein